MAGAFMVMVTGLALGLPASATDARIVRVDYQDGDVIAHTGRFDYATTIRFAQGERVASIAVGDPEGWQTTPNAAQTLVVLKPLLADATTNMSIVTDRRVYHFALEVDAGGGTAPVFELNLAGPPTRTERVATARPRDALPNPFAPGANTDYALKGDAGLAPTAIFDDGRFTYLAFGGHPERPALFGVVEDRREVLLNTHTRGPFTVIAGVQRQITLRLGEREACVFNRGYPEPTDLFQRDLAALAPASWS